MTPYEIVETIENELLDNIARNVAKGNLGTATWQVQKLADLGRLNNENQVIIRKHIKGLDAAITEEIRGELEKYVGQLDIMFESAISAGASLSSVLPVNADDRLREIIAIAEASQSSLSNLLANSMLSGADEVYSDIVNTATIKSLGGIATGEQAVTSSLRQWAGNGLPGLTDSADRTWQPESYMRMQLQTAKTNAYTDLCLERSAQYGNDLVEVDSHIGARPKCAPYQGGVYSLSGSDPDYSALSSTSYGEAAGLFGVNCVLGDTLVSGSGIRAAYRRKYTGEIITIKTGTGKQLSVTPNHPILTCGGWVSATELKEGDNVVSRSDFNRERTISPNPYNRVSMIEKVVDSFSHRGNIFRFPAASGYFHGDISDHDIDVIFKNSFLWDWIKSFFGKYIKKHFLHYTFKSSGFLFPFGSFNKIFGCSRRPPNGVMGILGDFISPIFTAPLMYKPSYVCPTFGDRDTKKREIFSDCTFRNTDIGSDIGFPHTRLVHSKEILRGKARFSKKILLPVFAEPINPVTAEKVYNSLCGAPNIVAYRTGRFAGTITLDNVVSIKREPSQGSFVHVYNLETKNNWYYSNGIISHNCQHNMHPFFKGISEQTYKQYGEKENEKAYKQSQRQRLLERKIRAAKREVSTLEAGGLDSSGAKALVKQRQATMRDFIDESGRTRQYAREQIVS